MDLSLAAFLIAIVVVGILIILAINLTSRHTPSLDQEEYRSHLDRIEKSLEKDQPATYTVAIISADKLLDRAMSDLGIPGKTMGDRLKNSGRNRFSELNAVWYAHKIRNQIAHENGFSPEYRQTLHALSTYKTALKDLGAI